MLFYYLWKKGMNLVYNEDMNKLWFKRKKYGWGWTPISWEGWLVTVFYLISLLCLSAFLSRASTTLEVVFNFFIPFIILTFLLILVAIKTGETPRWQWGEK